MIAPRATALALAGLLLAASPSSLDLEPAAATSPTAPGAVAAPTEQQDGERREAPVESEAAPRKRLESELLPATSLRKPQNGGTAVRRLGADLPAVAKAHGMQPAALRTTLLNDETLWVDPAGQLFVKEELHVGETFDAAPVAAAAEPLDQTLALHSKPGSQHVVHLDFDGIDLPSESYWSTGHHLPAGAYEGWDPMGDGPAFSDAERAAIQEIWARVAEDFAPFDVDVTTADPGDAALRTDFSGDTVFGTRLVVSDSAQASSLICQDNCGGVALLDAITTPSSVAEPAWVFSALNSQSPKAIAEAASHEVGHTFGLRHDGFGRSETDWDEYYSGQGTWAPIMGSAYSAPVSQWSNGFYNGATNSEDDVAKIAAIAGHRTDEGGDGWASPLRVTDGAGYVGASYDRDVYLVDDCTPGARAAAVTTGFSANLDVSLTLARPSGSGGSPVTVANPYLIQADARDERPWYGVGAYYPSTSVTGLDATVDIAEGGPWLLEVRGGDGLTGLDTSDYFSYGSTGAYQLQVEGCSTPQVAPARPNGLTVVAAGLDLVATWAAPSNDGGSPVTGYRVDLSGQDPVDLPADATSHTFPGAADLNVTVGVSALNAMGAGAAATATWNPTTVPSRVTDVSVVTDDLTCEFGNKPRCIEVVWHSPDSNGGSPVTHYEFWQGQDGEWWQLFEGDFLSTGKYEKWTNRFNPVAGEEYDYRIVAVNANGAGAAYDFKALLKGSPARITPTIATDRDDRTVTVTWETPFDGGEPIQHVALGLATGNYSQQTDVVLPPGTTSYTFTGVKTGPKHLIIAAANIWGPVKGKPGYDNSSDKSFVMPPISPDPGPIPNNTIQGTVLSTDTAAGTGSLRVFWEPNVPADPDHDPILWYDVCVDVIGEIHLPGDAIFGDGATRGTDLCGDRATLAMTVDATDEPFIDLTGLTLDEDHYVTVTPVNPGGPSFMPSMGVVNFDPTAITCPTEYTVDDGKLRWVWEWTEINVNYWNVRARRLPDTDWTVWASGQAYYMTGVYQRPVTPGEWEIEVTAALRNGRFGPPVVCAVTVPEPVVVPPTDPGTPTEPSPEPSPEPTTEPSPEPSPEPTTHPVPPAPAPAPAPAPVAGPVAPAPLAVAPSAPRAPSAKPGGKGDATTLTVKWSAPASAGSSAVTGYQVIVYKVKGAKLVVKARIKVPTSKHKLTLKLKQGKYRVAVRARNAVGWSPASAPSKAVQPR
ncbi:hypothetical protein EXE58_08660 [Nocardioides seonyuensis]|uniref:Fibronectin type-III domain-containing protein n=1 Tax=Nocardioides seonyuensis TaxID=2518371 RepID=A0A4P7IE71_9ACTN|nr:fibronectin type III domain-containing protein [Nocardioides seonyuensis]QBX55515.1 hypothetical protein EXE58_08660 [Nocardioides seonyuensis]